MAGKSLVRRAKNAIKRTNGQLPQRFVLSLRPTYLEGIPKGVKQVVLEWKGSGSKLSFTKVQPVNSAGMSVFEDVLHMTTTLYQTDNGFEAKEYSLRCMEVQEMRSMGRMVDKTVCLAQYKLDFSVFTRTCLEHAGAEEEIEVALQGPKGVVVTLRAFVKAALLRNWTPDDSTNSDVSSLNTGTLDLGNDDDEYGFDDSQELAGIATQSSMSCLSDDSEHFSGRISENIPSRPADSNSGRLASPRATASPRTRLTRSPSVSKPPAAPSPSPLATQDNAQPQSAAPQSMRTRRTHDRSKSADLRSLETIREASDPAKAGMLWANSSEDKAAMMWPPPRRASSVERTPVERTPESTPPMQSARVSHGSQGRESSGWSNVSFPQTFTQLGTQLGTLLRKGSGGQSKDEGTPEDLRSEMSRRETVDIQAEESVEALRKRCCDLVYAREALMAKSAELKQMLNESQDRSMSEDAITQELVRAKLELADGEYKRLQLQLRCQLEMNKNRTLASKLTALGVERDLLAHRLSNAMSM